ncbi:MAG: carboxypeptidase regulatory-like domain-containing protein [Armatimonadota bacterium]|nr:carboxypeptidase regulatory-like domain-containing protein [Armatimonadota bacterium]
MKRLIGCVFVAAALVALISPAWAITGRVVDNRGRPLRGVSVIVSDGNLMDTHVYRTNGKGEYTISYAKTAMVPEEYRKRKVTVRVLDRRGKPAVGATVRMSTRGGEKTVTVRTDSKGGFRYVSRATPSRLMYSVKVVDRRGKPLPKARLRSTEEAKAGRPDLVVDAKGAYSMKLPQEAFGGSDIWLRVSVDGYAYDAEHAAANQKAPIVITLRPEMKLKGRVVDERGAPIAGASVGVNNVYGSVRGRGAGYNASAWGLPQPNDWQVRSAKDGSFAIRHLPRTEGFEYISITMDVSAKGRARISKSLDLDALKKPLKVTLPREAKLVGTVHIPETEGGVHFFAPLSLRIGGPQGSEDYRSINMDDKGNFRMSELPPGKATLALETGGVTFENGHPARAGEPMPWTLTAQQIELKAGETTKLHLTATRGALVKGVALNKATGKPLAFAELYVKDSGNLEGYMGNTATDKQGRFAFRSPAGEVAVTLSSATGDKGERLSFFGGSDETDQPRETFKVEEGKDQNDVKLSFDLTQSDHGGGGLSSDIYNAKIPSDFALRPGTYQLAWDPETVTSGDVWFTDYEGKEAMSRMAKLPALVSTKPKYSAYRIDGTDDSGLLLIVLDKSDPKGKWYDTAYVDLNRNSDLTDDQPIKFTPKASHNSKSEWLAIPSHQGPKDGGMNYPVQVRLDISNWTPNDSNLQLERKGAWSGAVDSSKGRVPVMLLDSNNNGVFGDSVKIKEDLDYDSSGDYVCIDTIGLGRIVPRTFGPQAVQLCEVSKVGSRFYRIQTNAGSEVTIAPYEGQTGQIVARGGKLNGFKMGIERLTATSKTGYYNFDNYKGEPVSLPVGTYKIFCQGGLDVRDMKKKGQRKLEASLETYPNVALNVGRLTPLTFGGTISWAVDPGKSEITLTQGKEEKVYWLKDMKADGFRLRGFNDGRGDYSAKVRFADPQTGKNLWTTNVGYT